MKERLKSWAVWASALGALSIILQALGVFERIGITSDVYNTVITAAGTILTAFGILNNPTDRDKF